MKKGIVSMLLAVVILLTGCSAKTSKLVCTQSVSGVDIEFNIGFKGKIIDTMDFNYDMDLSKYTDTQISAIEKQDYCTIVKNAMSTYKEAFTDCKKEVVDKHLRVYSVLDIDKLTSSVLDKMTSDKAAKEELEKQGFTCTIK